MEKCMKKGVEDMPILSKRKDYENKTASDDSGIQQEVQHLLNELDTVRMEIRKEKVVEDVTILGKRKHYVTDGDTISKASKKSFKQDSNDLGVVQHILNEPEDQHASGSASKQPQKDTDDFLASCGLRFNPSEQVLVDDCLRKKNLGEPLDYCHPMTDVDVYSTHPQYLMDKYKQSGEKVWYFFTRGRPNENQTNTHWILGRKKDIFNNKGVKLGVKQLYVYCENNCKTQYKVVEYQLDPAGEDDLKNGPWFLCKIYKNRAKGEPKKSSGYTKRYVFPDRASYDNHRQSLLQESLNELQKERELLERELSSSGQLLVLEKKRELQLMLQGEQRLQYMLQMLHEERELRSSGQLY